jgi:predicted kinase
MISVLLNKLPDTIIKQLKKTMQDPLYHGEGCVYNHILLVANALIKNAQDTIDLLTCVVFHDLGKIDCFNVNEREDKLRIQTIGHENYVSKYIDLYKACFSEYIINWNLVKEVCQSHMYMHKYINGEIKKKSKLEIIEQNPYFKESVAFAKADAEGRIEGNGLPYLILTVGIPGSGKSTWARAFAERSKYIRISPDDIREEITGDISNVHRDKDVWIEAYKRIKEKLLKPQSVIFDATNINPTTRKELEKQFNDISIIVYKIFSCNPEEAKKRIAIDLQNKVNRSKVPEFIIDKMYSMYDGCVQFLNENKHIITLYRKKNV